MNKNTNQNTNTTVRTLMLAAFSLICSIFIWFYVTDYIGDEITGTFQNIKVVFEGESAMRDGRELVITSCDTTYVKASITGSRRTIASLNPADLTAVVDLNGISMSGTYSLNCKMSFPSGTDSGSITSVAFSPAAVKFYVDKLSYKTVPVEGEFNGSSAEGFSVEPLQFNPATVRITGPEQALAKVHHAWISVDRENVDKTVTYSSMFTLMDENGNVVDDKSIELEYDTVDVTLPVIAIREVDLAVNIIPGAGATEKNVKINIEPSSVILSGDSETLDGLNNIILEEVDLSTIEDSFSETYKIKLPNNTETVNGVREATVYIEITGLSKKYVSIGVNNLSVINCSEGYTAELISESIDGVLIRGPEKVLESISPANIRAVADLADFGTATGVFSVPARIYIDGTTEAGAIGEYKMYIRINKN